MDQDRSVADAAVGQDGDGNGDREREARLTRQVHVVLGLVIAGLGLAAVPQPDGAGFPRWERRARTRLPSRTADAVSDRPRPGPHSSLGVGPSARSGEAPTLSLRPRHLGRAGLVWLALVICAVLLEPLGSSSPARCSPSW